MLARGDGLGPLREQLRQATRVFVVASHFHRGYGALHLQFRCIARRNLQGLGGLLVAGSGLHGAGVFEKFKGMIGLFTPVKAGRAEENYRVLDLLAAEAPQRFQILRNDPYGPPFGAVEKCGVLVRERRSIQRRRPSVAGNHSAGRRRRSRSLRSSAGTLQVHGFLILVV